MSTAQRRKKYPDTDTFHFHNQNPKDRITTDCVIRAISLATEKPYNEVVMELAEMQCETGFEPREKSTYSKYLEKLGWVKHSQLKKPDSTKYRGDEFCGLLTRTRRMPLNDAIIAHIGTHHIVCIKPTLELKNGRPQYKVHDIWDSTDGCVGVWWTKD